MRSIGTTLKARASTLLTEYRLQLFAALWIPLVGAGAFGLSRLAPEGEAAGGVVLAAIALGGYRLTSWALDVLAPLLVERVVWPLLGRNRWSDGSRGAAFNSAARTLHYSGHDAHFGRHPELKEEFGKIEKSLANIARELQNEGRRSASVRTEYANLSPMRVLKVPTMYDLSCLLEDGQLDEETLYGTVFEMPDGSLWRVPHHAAPFGDANDSAFGRRIEIRKLGA